MTILRFRNLIKSQLVSPKYFSTSLTDSEYTTTPQYPPILDLSYEKRKERQKDAIHEKIKNVKTVEEKQIKLNMPKYFGFMCYMFLENEIPYNNLTLAQHVTRTHLIENVELPQYYENVGVNNIAITSLKEDLREAILFELEGYRKIHDLKKENQTPVEVENIIGSCLVHQLNRVITNSLSRNYQHLNNVQVDIEPKIESCWTCGGMIPTERVKSSKRNVEWLKHLENEPIDRVITYVGSPYLTLRAKQPLPFILAHKDTLNESFDVPFWKYDPRAVGISTDYRRIINIPGFWPGDEYKFGILQYLKRGHHQARRFGDPEDSKQALHRQGILASFGWLNAQANHLGFTTFNEITYPIVTQTIVTNGQSFSFYTYQLNTMLLHSKNTTENPKRNICWATPELKLYDKIHEGKLEGLNDDVLTKLVKFYSNVPSQRLGVNLTPYLSQDEKLAADYEDEEKREWLEREYKFLTSNRPRYQAQYEIYAWEKIYKIDHETRFMDKNLRPFEMREHPYQRTLDSRKPKYIPRALRPDLPKHKGRDSKEFFP